MQYTNPTDTDGKDWRRKYSEVVRTMEEEERLYRDQLQTLKRLIAKLCLIGNGQSSELDAALARLKDVIASESATSTELDGIGATIASALLEQERRASGTNSRPSPSPQDAHTATDPRLRDALARLLAELRRDPELTQVSDALNNELNKLATADALPTLVQRVGELATQRIRNLEKLRAGLETLIEQMVSRLDEMTDYIAGDEATRHEATERRDAFSNQMAGEVKALGDSVEASTDLGQLRKVLRTRLDSISRHLQDYRQRESDHARNAQERTEHMRERIAELEQQASSLQQKVAEEKRNSLLDPLTQVANRLGWDQRITEELHHWRQYPQPVCLLTWDIDRFKSINDNYGHTAGDKVLKIVAACLAKNIRGGDFIARYGGEEFVMLLPGTTLDHGTALADKIRDAVSKIGFHFSGKALVITISCGITALQAGDNATTAFERADKALYQAKQNGRNQVISG
ncbi:MAG TPA: diguanylate cyclase [Candidatus Acidoferrum sp.]|nr:diguanylate cyclase [Candidatus Acidoferrum sp.]